MKNKNRENENMKRGKEKKKEGKEKQDVYLVLGLRLPRELIDS